MNKTMFKNKVRIGVIDKKLVCLLYTVDRASNRPVKADIYSVWDYFKLFLNTNIYGR